MGWEVIFWNNTPFDLKELGYKEISLEGRPRTKTDLLKRAKIDAELDHFTTKFKDSIYQTYKFPPSNGGIKKKVKNLLVSTLIKTHGGEKGLEQLREKMTKSERKGSFYRNCKAVLEAEKPDVIFCTNQRPVVAIAPLTAAKDLGITTSTFIFSWDNLPKATMVVETDHYFVWSEHMKKEILTYYPHINPDQVHISGSPQFEPHFKKSLIKNRKVFCAENNLDPLKKFICFSGDDETTSPNDHLYLQDLASVVEELNQEGSNFEILFRRCPTDFTSRYDGVLKKHQLVITSLVPQWQQIGTSWNAVLPTPNDLELQMNTIAHSEVVVNLGSSMVFDFAAFDKPCIFINYDKELENADWSVEKIYNFVHFRSITSPEAVLWLNSKAEIPARLRIAIETGTNTAMEAKRWFRKINLFPPELASERIWEKIEQIT